MIEFISKLKNICFGKRLFSSYVVLLIIFSCLLFLFNLGKRDLWAPDEPRYAQVASEMWDSKDFILPHLNGEKYPDKPPLHFWLIILFSLPFGKVTELSARLPSALAGIGCVILLYYFGKQIFSTILLDKNNKLPQNAAKDELENKYLLNVYSNPGRIGFLAALILSTTIEYVIVSRRVSFDVLLTFIITLSLFCFFTGYSRKVKNTRYFLASYFCMGIATLTKGPVGFALPILVISTFLCIIKFKNYKMNFRIRDMRIGLGLVIVFTIPLLWVLGIYFQGGWEHTKEVVFTQNIGRTVNSWSHNRPFYYFFIKFPLFFLPWSVFLPGVIIHCVKTIKATPAKLVTKKQLEVNAFDNKNNLGCQPSHLLFPGVWFIVVFIFFSIMSGKRSTYILPLYPAAALCSAWFIDSFIWSKSEKKFKKSGYIPFKFICVFLIVTGFGIPIWIYYNRHENFCSVLPISAVFICGAILLAKYLFKSQLSKALICSFIIYLITLMVGTHTVVPLFNNEKSSRCFCENLNMIVGDKGKIASYGFFRSTYTFYTGRKSLKIISDTNELDEYLKSDERVYLMVKENQLEEVKNSTNTELYTLLKDSIGHRTIILLSNKPATYNDWY